MTVSAVVVRWRGGDEVERCLRSLLDHGGPTLDRIVLVDSGSGDTGAERLAQTFTDIEVLALPENRSFAWAAGQGVRRCSEPLLLLLNPDTVLTKGCLDVLVELLEAKDDAAGVVPLLDGLDGQPQHAWQLRKLPSVMRLATGRGGPPAFPSKSPRGPSRVHQPAAAAWLLRRVVWDALDGLDIAFAPAWWEDVDFCTRLERAIGNPDFPAKDGFWVEPRARVLHGGGSSLAQLSETDFLIAFNTNLLRYAKRHHSESMGTIRSGLRLSLLIRAGLRPSRRSAYLTAMREIFQPPG
jgi:GT2 family glycosyltransferase